MKKPIGGFYEFIIPEKSFTFHEDAHYLTNGRSCIRTIILNEPKMKKCYLPNYSCDAVCHPFLIENMEIEFYNIDSYFTPLLIPELKDGEFFFYINYYGLKNDVVSTLIEKYGDRLIIDNTHAFFQKRISKNWSFTSARKYFGVPDGAFLYSPKELFLNYERFNDYFIEHNIERLKGNQEKAFSSYQLYEKSLDSEIKKISIFSEKMLSLVNIENVILKRKDNFSFFQTHLQSLNVLDIFIDKDTVPYCFPFLPSKAIDKSIFYENQLFIPSLWTDPQIRTEIITDFEMNLSKNLLSLPIDERYSFDDLERIVKIIHQNLN